MFGLDRQDVVNGGYIALESGATAVASSIGFMAGGPLGGALVGGLVGGGLATIRSLASGHTWTDALAAGGRAAVVDGLLGMIPGGLVGGATRGLIKGGARNLVRSTRLAATPSGGLRAAREAMPRMKAGALTANISTGLGHAAFAVYDPFQSVPVVNIGNAAAPDSRPGLHDLWMPNQHGLGYPIQFKFSHATEESYRTFPGMFRLMYDTFGQQVTPAAPLPPKPPGNFFIPAPPEPLSATMRAYAAAATALGQEFQEFWDSSARVVQLVAASAEKSAEARNAINAVVDSMSAAARTAPHGIDEDTHIARFSTKAFEGGERLVVEASKDQAEIAERIDEHSQDLLTRTAPSSEPSSARPKQLDPASATPPEPEPRAEPQPDSRAEPQLGPRIEARPEPNPPQILPLPPSAGGSSPEPEPRNNGPRVDVPGDAPGQPSPVLPDDGLPRTMPLPTDPPTSEPVGAPIAGVSPTDGGMSMPIAMMAMMAQLAAMQHLADTGNTDRQAAQDRPRTQDSGPREPQPRAAAPAKATPLTSPAAQNPVTGPTNPQSSLPPKPPWVDYPFRDGRRQLVSTTVAQALDAAFADQAHTNAQTAYQGTRAAWSDRQPGSSVDPYQLITGDIAVWSDRTAVLVVFPDDPATPLNLITNGVLRPFSVEIADSGGDLGTFKGFIHPAGIEQGAWQSAGAPSGPADAGVDSPSLGVVV